MEQTLRKGRMKLTVFVIQGLSSDGQHLVLQLCNALPDVADLPECIVHLDVFCDDLRQALRFSHDEICETGRER